MEDLERAALLSIIDKLIAALAPEKLAEYEKLKIEGMLAMSRANRESVTV